MSGSPGSIKPMAQCGQCGHFASVHHGGYGGRPGGSTCATPECDCRTFVEQGEARVPLDADNLTAAEVAQLTGISVHTLSYWRQTDQGPKSIKAGTRTLYQRQEVERWLAEIDGRTEPNRTGASTWFAKAVDAADHITPEHTAPWKRAAVFALLAIAETLLAQQSARTSRRSSSSDGGPDAEMLTVDDVAAMTRLSAGTLRSWRHTGSSGPPSVKLGGRVLYRRTDVEAWLSEARR
ncbi:AlpA family transcriptional regulator [Mycolicibacterium sp. CBMA 226]|uniref:helix-turn-helix transcriptional regulator n=1 Tax=Mycolicibacterium sp. CBMA 226 TaxID=2606611 RepID=UPI0012DF534B|nr:helix-turn-helix domain-containing protein [Mycolicibacterium sp. CBMA 226]MUL76465.1 helix-turn-helix domain-containing protein [Mycolicibacterium sp. CBMA 226]